MKLMSFRFCLNTAELFCIILFPRSLFHSAVQLWPIFSYWCIKRETGRIFTMCFNQVSLKTFNWLRKLIVVCDVEEIKIKVAAESWSKQNVYLSVVVGNLFILFLLTFEVAVKKKLFLSITVSKHGTTWIASAKVTKHLSERCAFDSQKISGSFLRHQFVLSPAWSLLSQWRPEGSIEWTVTNIRHSARIETCGIQMLPHEGSVIKCMMWWPDLLVHQRKCLKPFMIFAFR